MERGMEYRMKCGPEYGIDITHLLFRHQEAHYFVQCN
jgi:hypothetical protein